MNTKPILLLSLGVNLLLGIVLIEAGQRSAESSMAVAERIGSRSIRQNEVPAPSQTNSVTGTAPFHWSQIESSDYRVYAANLRAIGCPERTLRDIITADVNDLYGMKVREIADSVSGWFWEFVIDYDAFEAMANDKVKQLEKIAEERKDLLALLLETPQAVEERQAKGRAEALALLRMRYEFLSAEQVVALQKILEQSESELARYNREHSTLSGPEREKAQRDFDATKEEAIKGLLSSEDYAEYRLRNNPNADLRLQLADMSLTDTEIRALVRAKSESKGADAIQQLLGSERYAEFQRAQDQNYEFALRLAERFDLPNETAARVYEMRREAETQARRIQEDKSRDAEERIAILHVMQMETERSLSEALGAKAFQAYQRNAGNWFLQILNGVK